MKHTRLTAAALGIALVGAGAAAAASSPSVTTGGATAITQTSATLAGTVNPNGSATSYYFDVGLTTSYGLTTKVTGIGSGTKARSEKGSIAGLIPGTTYHYRIEATNRYGTTAGADRTFTTTGPPPPQAQTGPATNVSVNNVTLTAVINPNGGETSYFFQYGPSTNYQSSTTPVTVPAGTQPVVVSYTVQQLEKGTQFHYRVVATHGLIATSFGSDAMFMTHPSPKPKPGLGETTTPRRDAHRPFVFTTTGRVRPPAWIPAQFGCSGYVAVRLFFGRRSVAYDLVPLQPNCSYSAQTVLSRKPGRGRANRRVALRVAVRFRGNGYLQTVSTRPRYVTVG